MQPKRDRAAKRNAARAKGTPPPRLAIDWEPGWPDALVTNVDTGAVITRLPVSPDDDPEIVCERLAVLVVAFARRYGLDRVTETRFR